MAVTDWHYAVMPVLGAPEWTEQAVADLLDQTIPVRLLIINQGVETSFRQRLERIAEAHPNQILLWSHNPPLLSLAATWNRALRFVWEVGGTEALVVNNDARFVPWTVSHLSQMLAGTGSWFVSAVGVTEPQYHQYAQLGGDHPDDLLDAKTPFKGGPDFSCFLISKRGHETYPFDEGFIPAYCEDLDTHRRYMLGGDGDKIFSVNLPYLHYASGTLKTIPREQCEALQRRIGQSRAYYERKWGGPVNQERYRIPFDEDSATDGVTTPELQAAWRESQASAV